MSFDISKTKRDINTAIELSVSGKKKEAFNLLCHDSLSEVQKDKIKNILSAASLKKSAECISEKVNIFTLLTTKDDPIRITNIVPIAKKIDGLRLETAKINFLGSEFVNNKVLGNISMSDLIKLDILESQSTNIHCYSNFDKLMSDFSFNLNGFQYFEANGVLLNSIHSFSHNPLDKKSESILSKASVNFISSWGRANSIQFDAVVPLGFLYRDLNPNEAKASKAYHLAHVDFRECDKKALELNWKPQMGDLIGNLSSEQQSNAHITQIVNLWMPLNKSENVLSLLDTSSVDLLTELRPFNNRSSDGVTSQTLQYKPNQRWVANDAMKVGQGIIFNSFLTPHSAVKLPKQQGIKYDEFRRSVEGRFVFISYEPSRSSP